MVTPAIADPRALRADARRNRERLLEVARDAFTQHGIDAPLDDIARRTGVGIGTLYRHFPTRHALVEALISDDADRLTRLADRLVADDVADGLQQWLSALVRHAVTFRGLAESLVGAAGADTTLGELCRRIHAAGSAVVRHAQRRGDVRRGVQPADAVDLAASIAWLTERDARDTRRRRLLQIGIDGLRQPG